MTPEPLEPEALIAIPDRVYTLAEQIGIAVMKAHAEFHADAKYPHYARHLGEAALAIARKAIEAEMRGEMDLWKSRIRITEGQANEAIKAAEHQVFAVKGFLADAVGSDGMTPATRASLSRYIGRLGDVLELMELARTDWLHSTPLPPKEPVCPNT